MNYSLLGALRHDQDCSGESLAQAFGCTRAAISKQVEQWRQRGVLIESKPGHGYRLRLAYEWWQQARLCQQLSSGIQVSVLPSAQSTNDAIREQALAPNQTALVVTDFQQGGRGRRGRQWLSLPGRQMTWSQRIDEDAALMAWSGLSIAIGVRLAQLLNANGFPVRLKWPNDLLLGSAKLGGILVEMEGQAEGPSRVVVGIGINEYLLPEEREQFAYPAAALRDIREYDRHRLLTEMVAALDEVLKGFPQRGLQPWREDWLALHAWQGRLVSFEQAGCQVVGRAMDLSAAGGLMVDVNGVLHECHSGDVSLRLPA